MSATMENVRFYRLMKNWSKLSDLEKDLVFCWMLGAGEYLDKEGMFQKLKEEMEKMSGSLSII